MKETQNLEFNPMESTGSNAFFQEESKTGIPFGYIATSVDNNNLYLVNEIGKYSIFDVANWFLSKESMTQKKLQKLCYYAQAWCYALYGYKLTDTTFEAWTHGPVSPALYNRFKDFGYNTIKIKGKFVPKFEDTDLELLESIWITYGNHTGNALEALSHSELPWKAARQGYAPDERCSVPISPDLMRSFYLSIYTEKGL